MQDIPTIKGAASPAAARQAMKLVARPLARMAGFVAALAVVIVGGGLVYTLAVRYRIEAVAIWTWLGHRTMEQLLALGGGFAVAPAMVAFAYHWVNQGAAKPQHALIRTGMRAMVLLLVLALYVWGARHAYRISLAVTKSPDWALIHSLYSWAYIAFAFVQWSAAHAAQPFARTVRQFWRLLVR